MAVNILLQVLGVVFGFLVRLKNGFDALFAHLYFVTFLSEARDFGLQFLNDLK